MSDQQPSQPSEIVPSQPESSAPVTRNRGLSLDPFSMLSDMEEMMDRMLGRRWPMLTRPMRRRIGSASGWASHVDMYEQGNEIVVKAELPGISRDDIDVSLENGDLILKGERKSEHEVNEESYYRMERSFGSFYRRLPLPEGVEADRIAANFQDGVLEVRVPKPTASQQTAKRIEVR